jgi:hypothetical protein
MTATANGYAHAYSTWISQGGGLNNDDKGVFKYLKGPMKGMTRDQAAMKFQNEVWRNAAPEWKDEYAKRATTDMLSPSEKAAQATTSVTPPTPAQAGQKGSIMQGPPTPVSTGVSSTPAQAGQKGSIMQGPPTPVSTGVSSSGAEPATGTSVASPARTPKIGGIGTGSIEEADSSAPSTDGFSPAEPMVSSISPPMIKAGGNSMTQSTFGNRKDEGASKTGAFKRYNRAMA